MKIGFVVERPTQFEAPFYCHATRAGGAELKVLFTALHPGDPVFDPELGRAVSWDLDLLDGYEHSAPDAGLGTWLSREIRPGAFDLLIINGYTQRAYAQAARRARRARIATALRLDSATFDGDPPPGLTKRLILAVLRRRFDLFLGVGSLTRRYLESCGVPPERIGLFPYAIDDERFRAGSKMTPEERRSLRERYGLPETGPVVLAVAKLHPRETPWDAIRALPRVADPSVILAIAGDGPDRAAAEAEAQRLAPDRVRFLGYVPYAELPRLYGVADAFVHAPREERWGVSVAEALAAGLPVVVSSRVGAGYDLIDERESGYRYPAGDSAALAVRLGEALALPADRVSAAADETLAKWGYAASWDHLREAAARVIARRAEHHDRGAAA